MNRYAGKWFAGAMILSLILATIIFVPVIGIVGISAMGESLFGETSTLTSAANTTVNATFSAFGLMNVVFIVGIAGAVVFVAIIYTLKKAEDSEPADRVKIAVRDDVGAYGGKPP